MDDSTRRPIRIVRVIARLNVGGPAVYTISLTAGLDPAQFRQWLVTGVAASYEGDMLSDAEARGVTPIVVPYLGRAIDARDDLRAFMALVRLFRQLRPDIVETHTAKAGVIGRLAAWAAGVPVTVHTFHGHVFHSYFSPAAVPSSGGLNGCSRYGRHASSPSARPSGPRFWATAWGDPSR